MIGGTFTGFAGALARLNGAVESAGEALEKLTEVLPAEYKPQPGDAVRPIEGLYIAGKLGHVGGFVELGDGDYLVMVAWPEGGWVTVNPENLEPANEVGH